MNRENALTGSEKLPLGECDRRTWRVAILTQPGEVILPLAECRHNISDTIAGVVGMRIVISYQSFLLSISSDPNTECSSEGLEVDAGRATVEWQEFSDFRDFK